MPTLTIQLPGLPSVEHIVREDAITLGRMRGNSISLSESSVSLSHARITRIGNDFYLKDLNSTNGTMLNGQSITEARLRDGDQLKLGDVIVHFRVEPLAAPASAPTPAGPGIVAASAPKPAAQSMPMPVPSAGSSVNPPPASAPRPNAPKPPAPVARQKSFRLPLFVAGAFAGLAIAGFLAWKFFSVAPLATATAPQVTNEAAPKRPPANNATSTSPQAQNLAALMEELKSPDAGARRRAAAAIYNLGTDAEAALPDLRGLLNDADPEVRMWVALTLVHNNIYDQASVAILIQTLHHENPTLRQVACLSLAMIPYTDAEKKMVIPALVEVATKDGNASVANDAMTALKIIAPDMPVEK